MPEIKDSAAEHIGPISSRASTLKRREGKKTPETARGHKHLGRKSKLTTTSKRSNDVVHKASSTFIQSTPKFSTMQQMEETQVEDFTADGL